MYIYRIEAREKKTKFYFRFYALQKELISVHAPMDMIEHI